jgi:hypothetical protein
MAWDGRVHDERWCAESRWASVARTRLSPRIRDLCLASVLSDRGRSADETAAFATYMGHISVASTEYYLSFLPDLAAAASDRFCARYGTLVQELPEGGHHA